jgi:uncharacterized ParB-like nuclease family protein
VLGPVDHHCLRAVCAPAGRLIWDSKLRSSQEPGHFTQEVRLTNESSANIAGPVSFVLDPLTDGTTIIGATGRTACALTVANAQVDSFLATCPVVTNRVRLAPDGSQAYFMTNGCGAYVLDTQRARSHRCCRRRHSWLTSFRVPMARSCTCFQDGRFSCSMRPANNCWQVYRFPTRPSFRAQAGCCLPQGTVCTSRATRVFRGQDSGLRIQDQRFRISDQRFRIRDQRSGIQSARSATTGSTRSARREGM